MDTGGDDLRTHGGGAQRADDDWRHVFGEKPTLPHDLRINPDDVRIFWMTRVVQALSDCVVTVTIFPCTAAKHVITVANDG